MKTVYTASNTPIQLSTIPIATPGAEGSVYKVITNEPFNEYCVKVFHELKRTDNKKDKLEFMIKNRPSKIIDPHYIFCWPVEIVYDQSANFVGFKMPLAFKDSEKLYELTTLKMSEKLPSVWRKFDRTTQQGFQSRLKVCVNVALALHSIHHSRTYHVVDFKPQNLLIDTEGSISITDVDSFRIAATNGTSLHRADVITAEYAPFEYHVEPDSDASMCENWDRFAMAVTFYETLFGIHPYTASCNESLVNAETIGDKIKNGLFVHGSKRALLTVIPHPHEEFHHLPESIKSLFIRAFESGQINAFDRPTAEEWGHTLFNIVKQNEMRTRTS